MKKFIPLVFLILSFQSIASHNSVSKFREAKLNMVEIFRVMDSPKTLYCGCNIKFPKRGGYMPDLSSCGYHSDKHAKNSVRIEAEHIMPAWEFGHEFKCWKKGGRKNCEHSDREFNKILGDLHNLYPSVGEVNNDRKNYAFTDFLSDDGYQQNFGKKFIKNYSKHKVKGYGQCAMVIDRRKQKAMPPVRARGVISRAYLYMSSRYHIKLSKETQQLYQKWNKMYAPDKNECLRNSLIHSIQGNDNPFVSRACHL